MLEIGLMNKEEIAEKISRRRRQILIHSIIYYKLNDNLISDDTWLKWAAELDYLQKKYPDIAATCVYAKDFADFDKSTGFNLPLDDSWAYEKALYLLRTRKFAE